MKHKVIYILIILFFVISCEKKEMNKISLIFNNIILFDNHEALTTNPNGIYFEILIKNNLPNTQCINTVDFQKQKIGHYISKLYLITKDEKYELIDLKPISKIKECSKLSGSLILKLMVENKFCGIDLVSMNKYFNENLSNSKIVFEINNKTHSININPNKRHFYYNDKEVPEKDLIKYKMKINQN